MDPEPSSYGSGSGKFSGSLRIRIHNTGNRIRIQFQPVVPPKAACTRVLGQLSPRSAWIQSGSIVPWDKKINQCTMQDLAIDKTINKVYWKTIEEPWLKGFASIYAHGIRRRNHTLIRKKKTNGSVPVPSANIVRIHRSGTGTSMQIPGD
jgi:hypothetical protein